MSSLTYNSSSSFFIDTQTTILGNNYSKSSPTQVNSLWETQLSEAKQSENSLQIYSDLQTYSSQVEIGIGASVLKNDYQFTDYSDLILKDQKSFISDHIMYPVPAGTKAAKVDSYWNAESTGQRILNFAMSFRSTFSDLSDDEFYEKIEKALLNGFANAKDAMGDINDYELAQLYNDTFNQTMSGLERLKNK